MLYLQPNPLKDDIEAILLDKRLVKALTGSESTKVQYVPSWNYLLIVSVDEDTLVEETIGYIATSMFNDVTVELHLAILPKHWGSGISVEVGNLFDKLLKNTGILKMIAFIPKCCVYPLRLLSMFGFNVAGTIPSCCKFGNNLEDILILERDVTTIKG